MLSHSPEFFKRLFETLDNNAVLMRVEPDGRYYPIWRSEEFCQMMEGTQDDFIKAESGGTMSAIHPDDSEKVVYLFKNYMAPDGTNSLTIRKNTIKKHQLDVCIHYAFIQEGGIQYAYCSYFDITDLKQSQRQTQEVYENMLNQFNAMADQSLTVFRTNLTKGVIEDVRGYDLYPTDFIGAPIAESAKIRAESFIVPGDNERYTQTFAIEKLLDRYYNGDGPATFVGYCKRHSGRQRFVKFSGAARKNPVTGDVTDFGIETEYNNRHVSEVLNNKVLSKQYDMVSYIVNGNYGVVIGDEANIKRGSIFPKERNGNYMDYLARQVLPVIHGNGEERAAIYDALSPQKIHSSLEKQESYSVDVSCDIGGEIFNKRFMFYVVDRDANFYLLLKSDATELIREQQRQNKEFSNALAQARYANEAKTTFLSNMSHMVDRKHRDFSEEDIARLADTFTAFQNGSLEDVKGFCAVASTKQIAAQDYILTPPRRYVGIEEKAEDDEPFADKMTRLTTELGGMFAKSLELEKEIKKNLAGIGFKI